MSRLLVEDNRTRAGILKKSTYKGPCLIAVCLGFFERITLSSYKTLLCEVYT